MKESIGSHEADDNKSVKTISVMDEGSSEKLHDETGKLKDEDGVTVVAGKVDGERVGKAVNAAAVTNDGVALELSNVDGGLTEALVRELLLKKKMVEHQDAEFVVRGVNASQDAAIRRLRAAGIQVETSQQMRRSAGLDVTDQAAA